MICYDFITSSSHAKQDKKNIIVYLMEKKECTHEYMITIKIPRKLAQHELHTQNSISKGKTDFINFFSVVFYIFSFLFFFSIQQAILNKA